MHGYVLESSDMHPVDLLLIPLGEAGDMGQNTTVGLRLAYLPE